MRVTCPCCGYRTLAEGPGAYEVCPVCHWEDDGVSTKDPLRNDGPNGISLREGQRHYTLHGSAHLDDTSLPKVRPPFPDEPRDPDWRPYASES